jgi:hypothetical protein
MKRKKFSGIVVNQEIRSSEALSLRVCTVAASQRL